MSTSQQRPTQRYASFLAQPGVLKSVSLVEHRYTNSPKSKLLPPHGMRPETRSITLPYPESSSCSCNPRFTKRFDPKPKVSNSSRMAEASSSICSADMREASNSWSVVATSSSVIVPLSFTSKARKAYQRFLSSRASWGGKVAAKNSPASNVPDLLRSAASKSIAGSVYFSRFGSFCSTSLNSSKLSSPSRSLSSDRKTSIASCLCE